MTVESTGPDTETASHAGARRLRREQLLVCAAAALIVVSLFLEGAEGPEEGASGAQIRTQLEDGMGALSLQVLGGSLAFLGLVLFTVGIRSLTRRRGGDSVLLDLTLLAGGLIAVWMWLQASVDAIPLIAADDNGQLDHYADTTLPALEFLTRLGETFGDIATVPRGLFVLAVSLLSLQTRLLPRWIGYFGLFVAAGALVGVAAAASGSPVVIIAWFVGLFGFVLWLLMVGVTCGIQALRGRHTVSA